MKARTKKLSIRYWNALSEETKKRAIKCVFPLMCDMSYLASEKPDPKNEAWWKLIFSKVRVPVENDHYKFVVNNTYYC